MSDHDVDSQNLFNEALLSPGVVLSGEARIHRPDGSELWLSTRAVNLLDDPAVRGIVVNVHDITDRKQAEEELVHQAFHDSLTGLANRALFRDRVEHALSRRTRTGMDPAVIYLDLDGFKNVNDGLGHEAGDDLLREVAAPPAGGGAVGRHRRPARRRRVRGAGRGVGRRRRSRPRRSPSGRCNR